jgi:uncharacterized protein (TIGR02186 family)
MRRALVLLLLLLGAGEAFGQATPNAPRGPAPADSPLITDLSSHLIAITSSFTGTELLLFGAIDEPGDIVVVVRGPTATSVVRRKRPTLGFWLTRRSESFDNVPAYYAVATSRPLREIAPHSLLQRLQIGTENLRFRYLGTAPRGESIADYERSIVRLKLRDGLYREGIGAVDFLGPKLFRTEISFPSTAPVGTYQTEVYLVRDERIVAAQSTPLFIDKQGIEQEVYDFSRAEPAVYGLVAVLMAVLAGWVAAIAFRRG